MPEKQKISEIMSAGVISIPASSKVKKAVDLMTQRNISCVVVTESTTVKKPVGIITERDLVQRILAEGKNPLTVKAEEIMTKSVVSISEEASLEEGMRMIESMKIRRLPVVNKDGLVGLVTQTDIVKETHSIHLHNKKLIFHQTMQSYVILALVAVFIIAFIIRMYFI